MSVILLDVLKSCCYRWNIPFPASGAIVGNADSGARQLLHIFYAVCEDLRQAGCWTQQKKIYSFATVSGTNSYQLPQDFFSMSPFTQYNTTETRQLIGPMSDSSFSARLNGAVGSSMNFEFRLFGFDDNSASAGGQFKIFPTPTSVKTLSFEYLTNHLLLPPKWVASTAYTITTSYVNANGNIYQCSQSGTSSASTAPIALTQGFTDGTAKWNYISTGYITAITDSDIMLFDEALIKLGIRAYWRDEKGEESDKAMAEFRAKIETAKNKLKPSVRGSFTRVGARVFWPRGDRDGGFLT